jgi:hypothetical protein
MLVAKLLFNRIISTKGAPFITMDISNFYLMTLFSRSEYIQVKLSNIPEEITNKYNLKLKATKYGSVYGVANCGMYGLLHYGLLAN